MQSRLKYCMFGVDAADLAVAEPKALGAAGPAVLCEWRPTAASLTNQSGF